MTTERWTMLGVNHVTTELDACRRRVPLAEPYAELNVARPSGSVVRIKLTRTELSRLLVKAAEANDRLMREAQA